MPVVPMLELRQQSSALNHRAIIARVQPAGNCSAIRDMHRRRHCLDSTARDACAPTFTAQARSPSFSASGWADVLSQLQGRYSSLLYGRERCIDGDSLSIIWLPLLDEFTLVLLTSLGVCAWEPRLSSGSGDSLLPLYAPHSTQAPGASIWRHHTVAAGVPSHSWVEVTHVPRLEAQSGWPYFYVAHGSGVSLNVGRTVALRLSSCLDRLDGPNATRQLKRYGVDVDRIDSVQMLDACDPADSAMWLPPSRGFRHEIVLLSTALLSEGDTISEAARATRISADGLINYTGPPAVMCGRVPFLFKCKSDTIAPQLMAARKSSTPPAVCSDERWHDLLRQCVDTPVRQRMPLEATSHYNHELSRGDGGSNGVVGRRDT